MRKIYAVLFFLIPTFAFAQQDCPGLICNPLTSSNFSGVDTIPKALLALVDLMVMVSMPIIALSIIYTGFSFAVAKGDPKKLEKARKMLTYVVVGTMIILAAKGIGVAIQSTINSLSAGQ